MQAQFFSNYFCSAPVTKGYMYVKMSLRTMVNCSCSWFNACGFDQQQQTRRLFPSNRSQSHSSSGYLSKLKFVSLVSCLYQFCLILVSCLIRGWVQNFRHKKTSRFYWNTACMTFQRMLNKQQTASLLIFDCGTNSPWTQFRVHNVLFEPLHGTK